VRLKRSRHSDPALDEWERIFRSRAHEKPEYDGWLEKYVGEIAGHCFETVIDLGCGAGGNSLFLSERGIGPVACDYSMQALCIAKKFVPGAMPVLFDYRDGLPFRKACATIVIADLSIHYFSWSCTDEIVRSIAHILCGKGVFLCRVNSIEDTNFGAGRGIEIENHLYEYNGIRKRFFDKNDIESLFASWNVLLCSRSVITRYSAPKILWEIAARKR